MNVPYISKWETGTDYAIDVCLDFVNERIRIDDYRGNLNSLFTKMEELAKQHLFTKLIVKARGEDWRYFLTKGFTLEGTIAGYFNGSDAFLVVKYFTNERRTSTSWQAEDLFLEKISLLATSEQLKEIPDDYSIRLAKITDCKALAKLYGEVFAGYPTPMNDENYIKKVIEGNTIFMIVEWNKQIVSATSVEINEANHNAEVTDCATLVDHRKYGFIQHLITGLEQQLVQRNIYCSYSLARAPIYGMNAILQKLGYLYSGRLTNNCMMNGNYENMNIWVKKLV